LCPYKIINTVGNNIIVSDRRECGNLVFNLNYSLLITCYAINQKVNCQKGKYN
jgi:hypothetical protein